MVKKAEGRRQISIIEQDLSQIPTDKIELEIMVGLICCGLEKLRTTFSEDNLFTVGVALAHAKIHAGLIQADKIDGGYYVYTGLDSDFDERKRVFARLAIPAYSEGFRIVEERVPQEIKEIVKRFYPCWFKQLGIPFSEQTLEVIQHPCPMVLPFDHYNKDRPFVGGVMRFPAEGQCRFFYNMKGWYLPPTRWVSTDSNNDSEALIAYKIKRGVDRQTALLELGSHEGAHVFSIDPIIETAKEGSAHCWLTEAFAQFYGDGKETMKERVAQTPKLLIPAEIAFKPDGLVDYGASYLLTLALATKFAGSIDSIPEGMAEILKRLAEYACLVVSHQAEKVKDPLELLYIIDPDLRNESAISEITRIMNEIRGNILR